MSFFKKLASDFEGLTTKDKDRAMDPSQQYPGQGQFKLPAPRP